MSEYAPQPFTYKGIAQKKDPAQLAPGEYYQAENVWSQQEGALTARTGHQRLTPSSLADDIRSLSKLNLGGADTANPRYLGSGTKIYRALPSGSYAETSVYSGLTSDARWTAQQYNAGTSGKPSLFFATENAAIRDNGSYATLQKWGVDPPLVPVTATPIAPNLTYLVISALSSGYTTRFIASVNANSSGVKTVSSMGAGPGYIQITPTAGGTINGVNGIYVGMILEIFDGTGGNEIVVVLAVTATSFYCVTTLAHSAVNVTLGWPQVQFTPIYSSYTYTFAGLSINAAFNGTADNGYETDDNFHIALMSTDVTNVTQIEIRIVPNYSGTPGSATDYYSYKIVPASIMSASTLPSSAPPTPAWLELNIPKNGFTKVGNAGSGAFTWLNINEIDIIATATSSVSGSAVVGVSGIYFIGGGGLNDSVKGATLYDWLYCYHNSTTGAEGNPCVAMATNNIPPAVTNGQMTLTLTGTPQAATIANGIGELSGASSIKIYRRGGTFADGLYRHIGYATNPGSGSTVQFIDNASDASLTTAETLLFDNDPPVPSSLPAAFTANILEFQPSGGGSDASTNTANAVARLVLSNLPSSYTASTIASVITVGSTVQVGFGVTYEPARVSAVGYGTNGHASNAWIEVWLQNVHKLTANDSSETIEIDSILRGNCDLVYQDFDCVFLAGDSNNPATLYQSKVGRPEAFPVVNLENNFAQQINVGSPSNPINGITSIGPGELVCLNLNNIFIVQVWAGQMQQPIQAPAQRGLYAKWCWCKGDNVIWYLAYDGIYAWAGGQSRKVSEQIDYLFKNQTVNGILPMNMANASLFSFSYAENCLFVSYQDTSGEYKRLKYETIYQRWTIESIVDDNGVVYSQNALFTEPDTGNFLVAITNGSAQSYLWLCDFYSTTDGWTSVPTDGLTIKYIAWRYWQIQDPTADYQVGEIVLELQNPSDQVIVDLYYNYSTSITNALAVASGALPARGRYFETVNSGTTPVQYAIGLKLSGTTGESTPVAFYTFGWRDFPWSDAGYPGPKVFEWLTIQANTNGVSVPMQLQLDGTSNVYNFNISGTFFDRNNTITLPSNLVGTQYRVVPVSGTSTTGTSGAVQIYGLQPKFEKQPIPITHWDSLMQVWGAAGWKATFQIWIDIQCATTVILSVYRDGNVLFFQQTLAASPERAVQRFYLPPVNIPAGGSQYQFNKSQSYQYTLDSSDGTTSFQLYRDGSRVEIYNLSSQQRAGFEERTLWELIPLVS